MRILYLFLFFLVPAALLAQEDYYHFDDNEPDGIMSSNQGIYYTYDASGNRTSSYTIVGWGPIGAQGGGGEQQSALPQLSATIGPSPTEGEVNVSLTNWNGCTTYTVSIYGSSGQYVVHTAAKSASVRLDISSQPDGIYVVEVDIDGVKKTAKIIKK